MQILIRFEPRISAIRDFRKQHSMGDADSIFSKSFTKRHQVNTGLCNRDHVISKNFNIAGAPCESDSRIFRVGLALEDFVSS